MSSRLLVIDDDQSILELFQLLFEAEGYEVMQSLVVFEQMNDVEHLHPDLIILDFKIGYYNEGWKFLQKLTMSPTTKDIPLILCTAALTEVREQEAFLRQNGIPEIDKPFDVDELLHVVQQFLLASSRDEEGITR